MINEAIQTEKALLAKIAQGDQQAFRIIYDQYARRIFLFAMSVLNSEPHAEEVMQEVMLKLWLMGTNLNTINNLEAYLRTTTRNRSLNILSRLELEWKTALESGHTWEEADNRTEEEIILNDTRKILEAGIEALPPQQKLVYKLCRQEGLKQEDVAKQMGLTPSTVQTHLKLAVKFLRNYVSKHTDITILLIILKLF